jgi:uncharacterized protein YndB with AHSA1/START domain
MSVEVPADGVLERHGDLSVLRFRRRLAHPPAKVWRALTEDEHLESWFPTTIEGDRNAGASLRFSFRQSEAEPFAGEVLAVEVPSLFELRWGDDVLRFDVTAEGDGCILDMSVTCPERGKAARDGAGWHVCLERLAYRLDKKAEPWETTQRWQAVHPDYVERFGPEASAIGPPQQ